MSFEKYNVGDSDVGKESLLSEEIESVTEELKRNSEDLENDLGGLNQDDFELLEPEKKARIFGAVKNIIGVASFLVAIPAVAALVGSEKVEQVNKFMGELVNDNFSTIMSAVGACTAALFAYAAFSKSSRSTN